jgi:phage replication O-like protein O
MNNNFTMIPNDVQDASFRVKLNGTQHRILEAVKRKTYGFHESKAKLSLNYLAEMIGAGRKEVAESLKEMESRRIIIQEISHGKSRYICINENTEEWVLTVGKKPHSQKITVGELPPTSIGQSPHSTVGNLPPKINKDLNKQFKESSSAATSNANTPEAPIHESSNLSKRRKSSYQKSMDFLDKMLEQEGSKEQGGNVAISEDDPQTEEATIAQIHTKVFGNLIMSPLISDFVRRLLACGYSEDFVKELMLETGESSTKPNLRYMQSVANRWISEGITSRADSRAQKAKGEGDQHNKYQSPQARTQEYLRNSLAQSGNSRVDITDSVNAESGRKHVLPSGRAVPGVQETREFLDELGRLRKGRQTREVIES